MSGPADRFWESFEAAPFRADTAAEATSYLFGGGDWNWRPRITDPAERLAWGRVYHRVMTGIDDLDQADAFGISEGRTSAAIRSDMMVMYGVDRHDPWRDPARLVRRFLRLAPFRDPAGALAACAHPAGHERELAGLLTLLEPLAGLESKGLLGGDDRAALAGWLATYELVMRATRAAR